MVSSEVWYRVDQMQPDGSVQQVQRTKVPGKVGEMTVSQAHAEALRFVQSINDLVLGVEHHRHTVIALVEKWRQTVALTLRPETLQSYRWALKRIPARFGEVPVSEVERVEVEAFLIECKSEGLLSCYLWQQRRKFKWFRFSILEGRVWLLR